MHTRSLTLVAAISLFCYSSSAQVGNKTSTGTVALQLPPDQQILSKKEIVQAQNDLRTLGYDLGQVDGIMGSATIAALKKFQASRMMPPTGVLDQATIELLHGTAYTKEAAAYLQKDPAFQEAMRASATSALEPARAPSQESVNAQNAALAPLLQRLQNEPCDPGFVREGSVCIERDPNRERRAAAFRRISTLQQGYRWQFYRSPDGHVLHVIDVSAADRSLSIGDLTEGGLQAFLKPNGEISGSDFSSQLDTLSETALLAVDRSDGMRINGLFASDPSHSDVEAFVVKDFGTFQLKKLKTLSATDETYELTVPSAEGHGSIASMTFVSTGKYIGGVARNQGEPPRKVSASECKQYLLILYDILANR
jgi:hypothetical protein